MKRKILALLTLTLSISLLGGCGSNSNAETTNNDSGNSSGGFLSEVTNSKSEVLSEVLSTGKVIAYKVDSVDKAETPDDIYFFDNGKVSIIPGEEFGLTMGDFSKMNDSEIWSTYETVKETYIENYKNEKVSSYIKPRNEQIEGLQYEMSLVQSCIDGLNNYDVDSVEYIDSLSYLVKDLATYGYDSYIDWEIYSKWESKKDNAEECKNMLLAVAETYFSDKNAEIAPIQAEIEAVNTSQCAIPFSDISFKFIIETDSSGNNVASEFMVYPTLNYEIGKEIISPLYDKLSFAQGLTREEVIYDTTYNCIAITGGGSFMTREVMDIDNTLDSEYVLIDLSKDELNELFKEEVTARYE